jgi:hypothetical protein
MKYIIQKNGNVNLLKQKLHLNNYFKNLEQKGKFSIFFDEFMQRPAASRPVRAWGSMK